MTDQFGPATRAARTSAIKAYRSALLLGGVTSIVIGLIVLIWPDQTLLIIAALLGIWLIAIGLVRLAEAFTAHYGTAGHRTLTGLAGAVYVVVGVICLANLIGTVRVLAVIIGIVWVVGGLFEMVRAITVRLAGWPRTGSLLIGALTLAAGVVVLVWPRISLEVMVWLAGLWLIAVGLVQLLLALMVNRLTTGPGGSPAYRPTEAR